MSDRTCSAFGRGTCKYDNADDYDEHPDYVCSGMGAYWASLWINTVVTIVMIVALAMVGCGCCDAAAKADTHHSSWQYVKWTSLVGAILLLWPIIATIVMAMKYGSGLWIIVLWYAAVFALRLTIAIKLLTRPASAHNDADRPAIPGRMGGGVQMVQGVPVAASVMMVGQQPAFATGQTAGVVVMPAMQPRVMTAQPATPIAQPAGAGMAFTQNPAFAQQQQAPAPAAAAQAKAREHQLSMG